VREKFELKPLHRDAIPRAVERAERYRFLGEPSEAESICRDILEVDPENHDARVILILALTDMFGRSHQIDVNVVRGEADRLSSEYDRAYYHGIISERQGKACLKQNNPGCGFDAYEWLSEAMAWFERAERLAPSGNDEAILRWNTCARKMMTDNRIRRRPPDDGHSFLE
jgi:hypothetical protein